MDLNTLRELVRENAEQDKLREAFNPWVQEFLKGDTDAVNAEQFFCLLEYVGYECVPKHTAMSRPCSPLDVPVLFPRARVDDNSEPETTFKYVLRHYDTEIFLTVIFLFVFLFFVVGWLFK